MSKPNFKKSAKRRAQRRDFVRRRNINANVPTDKVEEEVETFRSVTRPDGEVIKTHKGYKTKIRKLKQHKNHRGLEPLAKYENNGSSDRDRNVGMIYYPHSRKHTPAKVKTN